MLKKLLVCVPMVAVFAVTGLSASASATTAPKAAASVTAACTSDTPEVKALVTAAGHLQTALVPQPDAAKVQTASTELMAALVALYNAGCLPAPTTPQQAKADPSACLNSFMNVMSSVLGILQAAIKSPPDPATITTAMAGVGKAVAAFNTMKCLPFDLPVPGGSSPIPAPPIPAPPGLPGT
jgi:hypothetical protein